MKSVSTVIEISPDGIFFNIQLHNCLLIEYNNKEKKKKASHQVKVLRYDKM